VLDVSVALVQTSAAIFSFMYLIVLADLYRKTVKQAKVSLL
jgi:hypothetical protein